MVMTLSNLEPCWHCSAAGLPERERREERGERAGKRERE